MCASIACSHNVIYSSYQDIPLSGWDKDSVLSFPVMVDDSLATYDVVVSVRHGQNYPHQNLWFFIGGFGPEGAFPADTLEYYLANDRGRWIGNGIGDKHEMPCLIHQNFRFPRTGEYTFFVQHGMRDDLLRGVSEVGLIVEKHGQE